jgi:hypothetical protein
MSRIKHFEDGALVWVRLKKKQILAGKVLESSNVSTMEHAYELFKVELQQEVTDLAGQTKVHRWVHPSPIQGYKLSRRVEKDEVQPANAQEGEGHEEKR